MLIWVSNVRISMDFKVREFVLKVTEVLSPCQVSYILVDHKFGQQISFRLHGAMVSTSGLY